jgi:hypothetical protein
MVAGAAWQYGTPASRGSSGRDDKTEMTSASAAGDNAAQPAKALAAVEPATTRRESPPTSAETNATTPANAATGGNANAKTSASALATAPTNAGHVRILANPMANVEIDGKPRGVAPIGDVALPPGTHFIRLDCTALGEAVAQNVALAAGESVTISGDFTGAHGRILVRRTSASP